MFTQAGKTILKVWHIWETCDTYGEGAAGCRGSLVSLLRAPRSPWYSYWPARQDRPVEGLAWPGLVARIQGKSLWPASSWHVIREALQNPSNGFLKGVTPPHPPIPPSQQIGGTPLCKKVPLSKHLLLRPSATPHPFPNYSCDHYRENEPNRRPLYSLICICTWTPSPTPTPCRSHRRGGGRRCQSSGTLLAGATHWGGDSSAGIFENIICREHRLGKISLGKSSCTPDNELTCRWSRASQTGQMTRREKTRDVLKGSTFTLITKTFLIKTLLIISLLRLSITRLS